MSGFPPRAPGPGLALPPGEIHVWSARLDPPPAAVERLGRLLSPDEWERARRFRFDIHRRRFIVGRGVLRTLLGAYLAEPPESLLFAYGHRGKPELAGEGGLSFNLSHSEELALYALVRGPEVGVDVEYQRTMDDLEAIASRFFSAEETAALMGLPAGQRHPAFFNCWTRKEAYLKAVGEGLAAPLDSFVVTLVPGEPARMLSLQGDPGRAAGWFYQHLDPEPGYVGAVTLEGEGEWQVRTWRYAQG